MHEPKASALSARDRYLIVRAGVGRYLESVRYLDNARLSVH